MRRVLLFGIFDGEHEEHKALITEAREHGDELIVVVAQDHVVEHLLGRLPHANLALRFEELKKNDGVVKVVIGNVDMPPIQLIKQYKPDVITCAANQSILEQEIRDAIPYAGIHPEIVVLTASEKNQHHNP
ncbi:MAG: adenylyltransferase/cytidyltransferase family protein [Patescibacteria group bacterium]